MSKCIVIGVTGCVAAFKSVQLVSDLVKKGYEVDVIMTKNACEFIQPLQFESLIQRKVMVDTFDRNFQYSTQHISISKIQWHEKAWVTPAAFVNTPHNTANKHKVSKTVVCL